MQRLTDIVRADLSAIMTHYRDFTRETKIQCGAYRHTVFASLQADGVEMPADVSPINAYSLELYYMELDDARFNAALTKNAIIYIDDVGFRIVDTATAMGLRFVSLERKAGRGKCIP